jgi:hypothetical protein
LISNLLVDPLDSGSCLHILLTESPLWVESLNLLSKQPEEALHIDEERVLVVESGGLRVERVVEEPHPELVAVFLARYVVEFGEHGSQALEVDQHAFFALVNYRASLNGLLDEEISQ